MNAKTLTDVDQDRWNDFVATWPDFVLMQTYEWGQFKENTGWTTIRIAVEAAGQIIAGAQVLVKPLPLNLSSLAYVPKGPMVNWEDPVAVQTLLTAIHDVARQQRAISLKIEPPMQQTPTAVQALRALGFTRSQYNNQPQCSMVIDLKPDLDTILANMRKSTRYNIRYAARKGVTVREGDERDLPIFYRVLKYRAERVGFPIRSFDYYQEEWEALAQQGRVKLFLAMCEAEVLAMRMPAVFANKAATFHSGHFDTHRHLKPNELLMWECIKWTKSQGCHTYDVWGIPDEIGEMLSRGEPLPENQQGGLWGVYYFKRGFGGEFVYYVGAYDYVYSRPLYRLLDTAMSRLGSLDKLAQLGDRLNLGPEVPTGV